MKTIERLYAMEKTRIVGFGSSNTECCYPQTLVPGWLLWLDFGLRKIFGRYFTTINSGVSGQTSTQLLERFQEDVRLYKPHLIFLTVGGNDANPENRMTAELFHDNITKIIHRCQKIQNCEVILQTYYCPIYEKLHPQYAHQFQYFMKILVDIANKSRVSFYDHLPQWAHLREKLGLEYEQKLMDDPMHLNALGNQLWAYNILNRLVGSEINKISHYFQAVSEFQKILDSYKKI